jgi:hypothetical protein
MPSEGGHGSSLPEAVVEAGADPSISQSKDLREVLPLFPVPSKLSDFSVFGLLGDFLCEEGNQKQV